MKIIVIILLALLLFFIYKYVALKKSINEVGKKIKTKFEYKLPSDSISTNNAALNDLIHEFNLIYDLFHQTDMENKRINNELKEMMASISHDMRTPLTSVIGYLELVEVKDEHVQIAYKKALYLKSIIDKFYELSLFLQDETNRELNHVNLSEVLAKTAMEYYDLLKPLHFTIEIEEDIECVSNEKVLSTIFHNLFDNMLKYTQGTCGVRLKKTEDGFVIRFFNAFDQENEPLDYLFEKMVVLSNSKSKSSSGIGLYIVKQYLNELGLKGHIYVEDKQFVIEIKS